MPQSNAKSVVLEILRQADGEWTGKTKLFKAFYFAHLFYGSDNLGLLTDWPIVRMPGGPGIYEADKFFAELVQEGRLTIEVVHEDGPYPESRYRLTDMEKGSSDLPIAASIAVQKAVSFCKDKTASELSQITRERSRSWLEGENGAILNIDIDLIPEEEYALRQAELERLQTTLAALFDRAAV